MNVSATPPIWDRSQGPIVVERPMRRRIDMADIEQLLLPCSADLDLHLVREYFRLFDREGNSTRCRRIAMTADRDRDRGAGRGQREEPSRRSRRAVEARRRRRICAVPSDLLAWIDSLRRVFGDPPVDRRPSVGDDHRI
jgi:hypothetical protein